MHSSHSAPDAPGVKVALGSLVGFSDKRMSPSKQNGPCIGLDMRLASQAKHVAGERSLHLLYRGATFILNGRKQRPCRYIVSEANTRNEQPRTLAQPPIARITSLSRQSVDGFIRENGPIPQTIPDPGGVRFDTGMGKLPRAKILMTDRYLTDPICFVRQNPRRR